MTQYSLLHPDVLSCCCEGNAMLPKHHVGSGLLSPPSDSPSSLCSPAADLGLPWNTNGSKAGENQKHAPNQTHSKSLCTTDLNISPPHLSVTVLTFPAPGRSCSRFRTCLWVGLCGGAAASGADSVPESPSLSASASCSPVWPRRCV